MASKGARIIIAIKGSKNHHRLIIYNMYGGAGICTVTC